MTKNKLLLLLALLLTAATGAWADTSIVGPEDNLNDGYYSGDHKKNYSLEPGKTIKIEFTVSTATDDQLEGDVWNPWYAWAVNFWDGTLNAITIEPRNYGWEANTDNTRWTENWVKSWEINYPEDWESGYNFRDNMLQGATVVTTIKRDGADVIIIYDITTTSKEKYRQYVVKTYGDGTKTIWFDLIVDHCHITIDNDKTVTTDTENVVPTYEITMKDGVKDADKWTVKVGEGQAQALPIGGLKGDGSETVTLQYNGRLKVKGVKAVVEAPADQKLATPLTIEAITPGIISVSYPKEGMQFSLDGGATKNAVTMGQIVLAAGDKVQFYGNGTSITSYYGTSIKGSGNGFTCKVYGNIMSLVDETGFATATTLSASVTFNRLFYGNTTLTDASGLLLPATQLAPSCYNQMFMGCTALTTAPVLPATTLVESCYYRMFMGCTALTAAPELPATKLATQCYNQMFMGCTALTTAPVLPATTLVESCYYRMFMGCTALTTAPVLPATQLAECCYYQMFYNCSKLATVTCLATSGINQNSSTSMWLIDAGSDVQGTKTFNAVSTANWPTDDNGIPTGWTRVNIDN